MSQTEMIKARLEELKSNYAASEQQMQTLETRKNELQHTMSRIQGAIQVLEEMLAEQDNQAGA